ncbi:MAG: ATP-binding protein [Oscillospiraceae bacterium]|nr:ATP-binding protein [Oscillospiraceae bacterium]
MAIKRVEINDFLVFKGEFAADFCHGVNVIIGGNATGKTTLLRTLYRDIERDNGRDIALHRYKERATVIKDNNKIIQNVFIPEKDMLSIARGLPESYEYAKTDLLATEIAIIKKARVLPQCPEQPLYRKICNLLGGEPEHDGQSFFMKRFDFDEPIPFSSEASGYRKFALLALLIRNEQIKFGTVLFWDEPENSLNPELVSKLVDILLELAKNGVQMFIATHDYKFARYFDVRQDKSIPVMFHNLSKNDEGKIICDSQPKYLELRDNLLESASEELFDIIVADAMGVRKNA